MRRAGLLASVILISLGGVAFAGEVKPPAVTQAAPGIKRTILQKFDVPGTNYESTFMKVEFDANFDVPRHTHPGPEASIVLEGEITLILDGEAPRLLKPGDTTYFAPGLIHSGKVGPNGVSLLNSYVLEKGKPFMTKVDESGAPIP
jgi:quercetin dioxygenase-like cupin family protein